MTSSGASQDAWEYMAVCVPVVVLCAPLGSMLASHFHRLVLASFVYITDTVALVSALCLIPMLPNGDPTRIIVVVSLVVGGFSFFGLLSWLGGRYYEDDLSIIQSNVSIIIPVASSSDGGDISKDVADDGSMEDVVKENLGKWESNGASSSNSEDGDSPHRARRVSHHYY